MVILASSTLWYLSQIITGSANGKLGKILASSEPGKCVCSHLLFELMKMSVTEKFPDILFNHGEYAVLQPDREKEQQAIVKNNKENKKSLLENFDLV